MAENASRNMYGRFGKRLFDLMLTVPALIVLAPVFALAALVVSLEQGWPVFHLQDRPGLHGKPFALSKFRAMTDARDEDGNLLPDSARLTSLGRFLRSTSLDELPALINVLRGDMSLVGPRPLLPQYLPRYDEEAYRRHDVLPGVTGWAQVNGRNAISWEEKFALDVWYVDNRSLWLDLKVIGLTVWKIVQREGVSQPGRATMDEFRGLDR